jgi:hypothetical protein
MITVTTGLVAGGLVFLSLESLVLSWICFLCAAGLMYFAH